MLVSPLNLFENGVNTPEAITVVPITAVVSAAAIKIGIHLFFFFLGLALMAFMTFFVTLSTL